ncbi:hypothetical protein O181_087742 [Austropuccinia psidii MF-1]|uniref:Uncharacterized protein n=1 Tax=Austropuccinia psidii MF-1 TaxID=1389203 RepID=A0A9Q3IQA2_9BASI|nr:hypothetical protein [Austropuccinia psidii MF-1]
MNRSVNYLQEYDENKGELILLEMHKHKELKKIEINSQSEVENQKNQYLKVQEECSTEVHAEKLRIQKEEMYLKKLAAKQDEKQMIESAHCACNKLQESERCLEMEFKLKSKESEQQERKTNQELAQSQQKMNHEIN